MADRKLTPPERQIWEKVTKTVTPRRHKSAKPDASRQDFAAMMRIPPKEPQTTKKRTNSLDINQDKKVRRGRVDIDMTVDLHDLTRDQAYPALVSAIIRASNRNLRCVLVVTGKGARLEGVLRRAFPDWIAADPIRPLVATYAPAHIRHGGTGAWYVFLKSG